MKIGNRAFEAAGADHVGSLNCSEFTALPARFLPVGRLSLIDEEIHAERNHPKVRLRRQARVPEPADLRPVLALKPTSAARR